MLNVEKLKEWSWVNLQFNNDPEDVEDTFVRDIILGSKGTCHTNDGKVITYQDIRNMFEEEEEEN